MNVEQSMCAASGLEAQWEQINWSQCEQQVRRLQARIVKATQEGRHGKVKALQWLLTHSFCGRALAVKRVTHNQGKNTPGVDGAIWGTPTSRYKAIDTLRRNGYQPQPLRRVYIPKAKTPTRKCWSWPVTTRLSQRAGKTTTPILGACSLTLAAMHG